MKSVRTREEALDDLRRRRRRVGASADGAEKKLNKMSPEHKNLTAQTDALNRLREEMRTLDGEIIREEAELGDFKRKCAKSWMQAKFGGLVECCEKGVVSRYVFFRSLAASFIT
jgi:predicted RNase H-like nuclease (RuvC/YqgF family)